MTHLITYQPRSKVMRLEPDFEDTTICGLPKPFDSNFNMIGGTIAELSDSVDKEPYLCKDCVDRLVLLELAHYL